MDDALGNPTHDPHGAPIPTANGEIERTDSLTLMELEEGVEAQVRAVRDDDSRGLQAAEAAGLLPGSTVQVLPGRSADGKLRVLAGESQASPSEIPEEVAARVYIVPLSEGESHHHA